MTSQGGYRAQYPNIKEICYNGGTWDFENKYSSQVVVYCCSAIQLRLLLL